MKWSTYEFDQNNRHGAQWLRSYRVAIVMTLFWILFSLAAICFLSIALGLLIVWLVVRRIRRSRAVHDAMLRTRRTLSWGQRRKVLTMRLRLAESLESGRAALNLLGGSNNRAGEFPALFHRLEAEARSLDTQLRLMETETDASVLANEVPAVGVRVKQFTATVSRMRASVSDGLGYPSEGKLAELHAEVDREVIALHAGQVEFRRLSEQQT